MTHTPATDAAIPAATFWLSPSTPYPAAAKPAPIPIMELFGNAKQEPRRSYPKPEHGIPGHDTFSRLAVPGMLDPTTFQH